MTSATGSGTATFTTSNGSVTGLAAVAEATLPTAGKPAGVTFPHGLFSFNITNIVPPGSCVTVTITLPSAVPVGTTYWKYQGGWIQIPMGSDDGDNVITINLCDGGLGDSDGFADGTIVDPGGPAVVAAAATLAPAQAGAQRASPAPPRSLNPPQMSLQYLSISSQQASAGQPVTISTNVVNTGDESGNYNVELKINGQVEETRMVSVGPQGTQPVKFTITKDQPGTYTVNIGYQKTSFIVTGAGGSNSSRSSSGLIVLLVMAVLVLTTVVVLMLNFRRQTH